MSGVKERKTRQTRTRQTRTSQTRTRQTRTRQTRTSQTRTRQTRTRNPHKPLQKLNCSPKPKNEINEFSCYTNKDIYRLRNLWNARHPDQKITTNSPKEIHKQLAIFFQSLCNKESCWIKHSSEFSGNVKSLLESFSPESPKEWKKNPNEWLTSVDIMNVMKQYEKAYKCFDFIGPSPIDFDTRKMYGECVWDELCNFNLEKQIKDGKTKIGVIFNTDPHDKSGEHWISLFINITDHDIFFFDSTGDPPPKEISVFMKRVQDQGMQLSPPITFKIDSTEGVEHQYGNTECGIYSLYFIVHMLENKNTKHYLKTHILKDGYINKFRKVYFNESLT